MSAVTSQSDFDGVRAALVSIFEANEAVRRGLYEKGELFNDNYIKFSVADLHRTLENTPRRKLPQLVEKVIGDFNFRAIHGDWALVKHDAPDFTLIELPHSATSVVGIVYSKNGYTGKLVELGETDFAEPEEKPKKEKPVTEVKPKGRPVKTENKLQEEFSPADVEKAPDSLRSTRRRIAEVDSLTPEERRQTSGTYQQLKFVLLSQDTESLNELAETLNIGELEGSTQQAVNELLDLLDFESVRDAADNMGITLKARNNPDAALLEFLIAQSK